MEEEEEEKNNRPSVATREARLTSLSFSFHPDDTLESCGWSSSPVGQAGRQGRPCCSGCGVFSKATSSKFTHKRSKCCGEEKRWNRALVDQPEELFVDHRDGDFDSQEICRRWRTFDKDAPAN